MNKLRYTGKLFSEFAQFARQNKIYWIMPLLVVLVLAGLLVVASQGAAPFIYTLF